MPDSDHTLAAYESALHATGAPMRCAPRLPDIIPAGRALLSCVGFDAFEGGYEVREPIGTAFNVSGHGVTLVGMHLFGCTDTAMTLNGREAYVSVRLLHLQDCISSRASNVEHK